MKLTQVAAAVLLRPDGSFLLGRRGPNTFFAGYWEFPGGKVEAGETPRDALVRELQEELGIKVRSATPWIVREHHYEHAHVRLNFFRVTAWQGEITDHVHSALAWQRPGATEVAPMLPANGPVLKSLVLPGAYAITDAAAMGIDAQLQFLDRQLAAGLRLVQVREPALAAADRKAFAREVVARVHRVGGIALINSDIALATEVGADGVHLPAAQAARLTQRPDLPWVAASCHHRQELEQAARLGADFAVLGPVQATASHPGQVPLGWAAFAEAIAGMPMPVYALGGLGGADLDAALAAGGQGVAAIRGAWASRGLTARSAPAGGSAVDLRQA